MTALCAGLVLCALAPRLPAVEIEADTDLATAGYYQLRWRSDRAVVVEEAGSADFESPRVIYRGLDNATVISGKPDGEWYYRARGDDPRASFGAPLRVTVHHHSLGRALGFFAVGAIVFLGTLALIVTGARRAA